jgi:hypothetical protein
MNDAVTIIREALARAEKDARKGVDTHSPTCYLWHPECARVRVNAMVKSLEQLERNQWVFRHGTEERQCLSCHRPASELHADTCPFAPLDKWQLRGVGREEGAGSPTEVTT